MKTKTPNEIVQILHSIKEIHFDGEEIEVSFQDSKFPESLRSFEYGSFTRELLELISHHLSNNESDKFDVGLHPRWDAELSFDGHKKL